MVKEQITNTVYNIVHKLPQGKDAAAAIKSYFKSYPFLTNNNNLQDYYIFCLAMETGSDYSTGKENEGRLYLDDLKAALDGQPALARRSEKYIEAVIPEVCGYYARKKNYKTVKDHLLFFKKLLPDNEEINRRLKNVEIPLSQK